MILMAYRHGFRAAELVDLRWDMIDFDTANLAARRAKKGSPSTHPIMDDELRALRRLNREGSRIRSLLSSLRPGAAHRSELPASLAWWSVQAAKPAHAAARLP